MNYGFRLHDDGCLEITVPKGTKVENVWVRFCGERDGTSKIFTPMDIKVSEPEPVALESALEIPERARVFIQKAENCKINIYSADYTAKEI